MVLNEKINITKSSFERNMKSSADSIYSPNRFELINCETTEKEEINHPYHKIPQQLVLIDTSNQNDQK